MSELKLLPRPICGDKLKIHGPEDRKPTYSDPDSGGDPYSAFCDCGFQYSNGSCDYSEFVLCLNRRAQTENKPADAVPVVRGEWIMDTDPDDGDCRCSNCKVCIDALHRRNHKLLNALGYKLHTFYKYCPNCGAKMEDKL